MDKKVSVIIPTYKRSEFLHRAVDSVLRQTYQNIEIIVVDDNPPNSKFRIETEKKIEKYTGYKNVIYIKNEKNLGGALARNRGIEKASGEYVTFLDDDDIYLPDKVKVQVNYMMKNDLDMSFTDVRIHNMKDKLVDYRRHFYIKDLSNYELLKQHIMHHLTPTATYMIKKKSILDIGGFENVEMGQEFMLMLKAIESGLKIGYIPKAYVIQYIHDGERISIGGNKIKKEKEMYMFKKKYFEVLNFRQRQYVKFRHHMVLGVVGMRSEKVIFAISQLLLALVVSPIDFIQEIINHKVKMTRYKYNLNS